MKRGREVATTAWLAQVRRALCEGKEVSPRRLPTFELRNVAVEYDARCPVVCVPERKLSLRFLSAEPLWILSGSDRLEEIAPYNPKMSEFSDDGKVLAGAYGPPISRQLEGVVGRLVADPSTRQSVLTVWAENPPESRDIPCTVAMAFSVREEEISSTVFMRSSDVWLGLPYDMMTFAAVLYRVAAELAEQGRVPVRLGTVTIFMASSHLYAKDAENARALTRTRPTDDEVQRALDEIARTELPERVTGLRDYRAFTAELERARDARVLPLFAKLAPS